MITFLNVIYSFLQYWCPQLTKGSKGDQFPLSGFSDLNNHFFKNNFDLKKPKVYFFKNNLK